MIEIYKDELRMDETVLRYATSEEKEKIGEIAEAITARARKAEEEKNHE